jgi:iron complex transport system permease protein
LNTSTTNPGLTRAAITLDGAAAAYSSASRRKVWLFWGLMAGLAVLAVLAVATGSYQLSPLDVILTLLGRTEGNEAIVVWNLRLPRIVSAIVAGWGLSLSGVAIQCLIRNPLGSPFTLGISHGAAFGAALAIVVLGAGGTLVGPPQSGASSRIAVFDIYLTSLAAFAGAMVTTLVVLLIARLKRMAPEAIILAGVALSSIFVSGTILIQYFATEVELAAVVFWTFGDVARAGWPAIAVMSGASVLGTVYFIYRRWDLNALAAGEDVARGLGLNVTRLRLEGMVMAALVAALAVAFLGVIAFLGLLAPHIAKRLVGADHRFLIPHSCVVGAVLLLLADTCGRVVIGSGSLPVGVLTSFLGAPLFLYLLLTGDRRR